MKAPFPDLAAVAEQLANAVEHALAALTRMDWEAWQQACAAQQRLVAQLARVAPGGLTGASEPGSVLRRLDQLARVQLATLRRTAQTVNALASLYRSQELIYSWSRTCGERPGR